MCFRNDRPGRIGGGVALWIRCSILSSVLPCKNSANFECLLVKLPTLKIFIMAVYLPPNVANSKAAFVRDFMITTMDNCLLDNSDFDVVIAGDLNRFAVDDVCRSLSLRNINNRATYANAELDYILFSESLSNEYVISLCAPFDRSKIPHMCLVASPQLSSSSRSQFITRRVYDLRSSFLARFVDAVNNIDWSFLDNNQYSLNHKCSLFQGTLEAAVKECIPVTYVKFGPSDKPWITPLVKELINKRWSAYRRGDYPAYNCLKVKVRAEIQKAKLKWTEKMQEKDIWKAVDTHLGRNSSTHIFKILSQTSSVQQAVEHISSFLHSVFVSSDWESTDGLIANSRIDDSDWNVDITPSSLQRILGQLSRKKSSPDIPIVLYQSVASQLSAPLSKLLKLSFHLHQVPESWKRSVISPIPKSRNPSFQDVRPISLLPPLAKIMERVVLSTIKGKLLENYGMNQFGFRPNSSTQCALAFLHNQVTSYLDDPSTFGVVIISYDYSKAFDRLRPDLIIKRMIECNFSYNIIAWMADYLRNRTQVVRIGEVMSCAVNVTSGVPQGSILGPFLYSFATATYCPINNNQCHFLKYADDTSLIFPLYRNTGNVHITEEHQHLLAWSAENGLSMNVSKCKSMVIRKANVRSSFIFPTLPEVESVEELRILGVIFNTRFTWTNHVDYIIKKCSRLLFAFRTIRSVVSPLQLRTLYFSLVRSLIDYCSPVYIGLSSHDSNRLEYLQKRFHRIICSSDCKSQCLSTLKERRLLLAMKFLVKAMDVEHILFPHLPSRSKFGRFILPFRRTECRSKTFFLYACERYNHMVRRGAPDVLS